MKQLHVELDTELDKLYERYVESVEKSGLIVGAYVKDAQGKIWRVANASHYMYSRYSGVSAYFSSGFRGHWWLKSGQWSEQKQNIYTHTRNLVLCDNPETPS